MTGIGGSEHHDGLYWFHRTSSRRRTTFCSNYTAVVTPAAGVDWTLRDSWVQTCIKSKSKSKSRSMQYVTAEQELATGKSKCSVVILSK